MPAPHRLVVAVLVCGGLLAAPSAASADTWNPPGWWQEAAGLISSEGGNCTPVRSTNPEGTRDDWVVGNECLNERTSDRWWYTADRNWDEECQALVVDDREPSDGYDYNSSSYKCEFSAVDVLCTRDNSADNPPGWREGGRRFATLEACRGQSLPLKASLFSAPRKVRVDRRGVFAYRFRGTPGYSGRLVLKTLGKLHVARHRGTRTLAVKRFRVPASGKVRARVKLGRRGRRLLARQRAVPAVATVTQGTAGRVSPKVSKDVVLRIRRRR